MRTDDLPRGIQALDDAGSTERVIVDGDATVIPITRGRGRSTRTIGALVVRDGNATWVPTIDQERLMMIGALTGLAAATLACLAVLRKPPWPDVTITRTW
jgi:hypothetical protein